MLKNLLSIGAGALSVLYYKGDVNLIVCVAYLVVVIIFEAKWLNGSKK